MSEDRVTEGARTPRPTESARLASPRRGAWWSWLGWVLLVVAVAVGFTWAEARFGHHAGRVPSTAATVYACPMHSSVTADHPGECPICGMELVPRAPASAASSASAVSHAGHRHVPTDPYVSPMHPEETSLDPSARCPICGMKMAPRAQVPEAVEIARRAAASATASRAQPARP